MAEGTRLKMLDDHVHALEQQLRDLAIGNEKKFEALNGRIDAIRNEGRVLYEAMRRESANTAEKLEQILELLMNGSQTTPSKGASSSICREERGIIPTPQVPNTREDSNAYAVQGKSNFQLPYPKLEFPTFSGENPRNWIRRCEKYFEFYGIKEYQRLELVAMHLESKADTWFQGYLAENGAPTWLAFTEELCKRFDARGLSDVVEEFNKLTQQGTVEEYQEQFEELRSRLLTTKSQFTPEYFLSSFLSGLKEEIRAAVKMLQPKSLTQAFEQAKLQELNMLAMMKRSKMMFRSAGGGRQHSNFRGLGSATSTRGQDTTRNPAAKYATERPALNRQLIEQRRVAGLCFKCGDKYSFGHQCKPQSMNAVLSTQEVTEVFDEELSSW